MIFKTLSLPKSYTIFQILNLLLSAFSFQNLITMRESTKSGYYIHMQYSILFKILQKLNFFLSQFKHLSHLQDHISTILKMPHLTHHWFIMLKWYWYEYSFYYTVIIVLIIVKYFLSYFQSNVIKFKRFLRLSEYIPWKLIA